MQAGVNGPVECAALSRLPAWVITVILPQSVMFYFSFFFMI